MRGEVLALGAVGALAIAAAAQGAQRGARASLGEGEIPSFSWWVSYTDLKGERHGERMISHSTADRWADHLRGKGFSRIHTSVKRPRDHVRIGWNTRWMTPKGSFAYDVKFLRSLGSEFLSFDPDGKGEIQVDFRDLPEEVRARAETISRLRKHNSAISFGDGHTAAVSEISQGLQKLQIGSLEWLILFEELKWAVDHPFGTNDY